ncbi:MAG: YceI family protein [Candidatus Rariloculaceae bacterium]
MNTTLFRHAALGISCAAMAAAVIAEPVTYEIDPRHTFPSFEADHQGGISVWRGKIESSSGTIVVDQEAKTGTVNVTMEMDSIDFGLDAMTDHAKSEDILDVPQFPTASYEGTLTNFTKDGDPTAVEGEFTLHGVTQPLDLQINRFRCHTAMGADVCGADAIATFSRDDYGVTFGQGNGFLMYVNLQIQVEAARVE